MSATRYTDTQVRNLSRGYGRELHDAEDASDNRRIFKASDAYDAFFAGLPPRQQKIASEAHMTAHYAR